MLLTMACIVALGVAVTLLGIMVVKLWCKQRTLAEALIELNEAPAAYMEDQHEAYLRELYNSRTRLHHLLHPV